MGAEPDHTFHECTSPSSLLLATVSWSELGVLGQYGTSGLWTATVRFRMSSNSSDMPVSIRARSFGEMFSFNAMRSGHASHPVSTSLLPAHSTRLG